MTILGFPRDRQLYVSLHTAEPSEQGMDEVSYRDYERQPCSEFRLASDSDGIVNLHDIDFPCVSGGWVGDITHVGYGENPTGEGALYAVSTLRPPIFASSGVTLRISAATRSRPVLARDATIHPVLARAPSDLGVGVERAADALRVLGAAFSDSSGLLGASAALRSASQAASARTLTDLETYFLNGDSGIRPHGLLSGIASGSGAEPRWWGVDMAEVPADDSSAAEKPRVPLLAGTPRNVRIRRPR